MIGLSKPDPAAVERFLARQADRPFTYAEVGQTAGQLPAGYAVNHTRTRIGQGSADFAAAQAALRGWCQLDLGWVAALPTDTRLAEGRPVAIVGHALGCYWWNACRIIYTVDHVSPQPRFGFAYGTLPVHVGSGEERFLVEMDEQGNVWYDILAFSKPHGLWGNLGSFYLRRQQARFGRESSAKMKSLVAANSKV